jgi:hypothetical protein
MVDISVSNMPDFAFAIGTLAVRLSYNNVFNISMAIVIALSWRRFLARVNPS